MTTKQQDWEKRLDELIFGVFGKYEIELGKFAIIPGKHYGIKNKRSY